MKKENIIGFAFARRFADGTIKSTMCTCPVEDSPEVSESNSPSDSLLRVIYAPDERTGLPTGDLQYFVSDKANPQIKQFILDNLMKDVSVAKNPMNADMSDDDMLLFARKPNESIDSYAQRLNNEIERAKWINEQVKNVQSKPAVTSVPSE